MFRRVEGQGESETGRERDRYIERETERERERDRQTERDRQRQTGGLEAGDTADVPGAEGQGEGETGGQTDS